MKKFLAVCGGSLLTVLLLAVAVCAEEVKTDYFTFDLPADWKSRKVENQPDGNAAAVVQNTKDGTIVGIRIMQSTGPIKAIATRIVGKMKGKDLEVSEMKQVGESYVVEFTKGPARGVQYFTSNGKHFSVVSILGETDTPGKTLLQENFKPLDPRLFPASF